MSTNTLTKSQSDAFTEARARYVMGKISDEFNNIIFRGFTSISSDELKGWRDDMQFIMDKNALKHFEIQFRTADKKWAVRYEVMLGGITRDDESGGLDFYKIPATASLSIVVKRDKDNKEVSEYLERRGWGTGGEFIAEGANSDKSFSKDSFGVNRKTFGDL